MNIDHAAVGDAVARHARIAFHLSGGRDSVAALYAMREWWPRLTVYHVDTGDQFPEIHKVLNRIKEDGLDIEVVYGGVEWKRDSFGWPADLVPADNTPMGQMLSGRELRLQSRFDCCARVLMEPMHQRMVADRITLIVRGQRADEFTGAPPLQSGQQAGGFEVLFPIERWSAADVMSYSEAHGLPVAGFYAAGLQMAPDCMACTAWNAPGRARYMREQHPVAFYRYLPQHNAVQAEIKRQLHLAEQE